MVDFWLIFGVNVGKYIPYMNWQVPSKERSHIPPNESQPENSSTRKVPFTVGDMLVLGGFHNDHHLHKH